MSSGYELYEPRRLSNLTESPYWEETEEKCKFMMTLMTEARSALWEVQVPEYVQGNFEVTVYTYQPGPGCIDPLSPP